MAGPRWIRPSVGTSTPCTAAVKPYRRSRTVESSRFATVYLTVCSRTEDTRLGSLDSIDSNVYIESIRYLV